VIANALYEYQASANQTRFLSPLRSNPYVDLNTEEAAPFLMPIRNNSRLGVRVKMPT